MELPNPNVPFQEIVAEHQGLLARLALIEAAARPEQVQEELRALVALLELHFEAEERPGGMFARVRAQDPRLGGEIDALRSEHVSIVAAALSLIERAAQVRQLRLPSHDFVSDVQQFTTQVRRHEAREDALLADAHYHEEGGGD